MNTVKRSQVFAHGGVPLTLTRHHHHGDCALHRHEFTELVVVTRGVGIHLTPSGEYPLSAGDVFVLHGNQAHAYRGTEELGLVNILFDMDELNLPRADIASLPGYHVLFNLEPLYRERDRFESRLRLDPDHLRHVTDRIAKLEQELQGREPGRCFAAIAHFMLLLADLSRFYARVEDPAVQPLQRLGRVIGYLEQHLTDPLGLEDLARAGCMSRRTLSRAFRSAMGCSPVEYLTRRRAQYAAELLRGTDLTITEIALRAGFQDSNYFSRRFRAVLGSSPRAYRAGG